MAASSVLNEIEVEVVPAAKEPVGWPADRDGGVVSGTDNV